MTSMKATEKRTLWFEVPSGWTGVELPDGRVYVREEELERVGGDPGWCSISLVLRTYEPAKGQSVRDAAIDARAPYGVVRELETSIDGSLARGFEHVNGIATIWSFFLEPPIGASTECSMSVGFQPDGGAVTDIAKLWESFRGRLVWVDRLFAQSSVAPDGSPSVAPEAGAPSSAPRVNAGIGPAPESDDGDDKNGQ